MFKILHRCHRVTARLLHGTLVIAVALLVLDVLLGVASRYLWGEQVKWTEELATLLLVWVSFLGIAAAFDAGSHLGIDVLTERFTPECRRKIAVFASLTVLFFATAILIYGGSLLVMQAIRHWNILPALQISDVVFYLPLPVSGVLIVLGEGTRWLQRLQTAPHPEESRHE